MNVFKMLGDTEGKMTIKLKLQLMYWLSIDTWPWNILKVQVKVMHILAINFEMIINLE